MILPILLIGGGIAGLVYVLRKDEDDAGPVPQHEPDYDVSPFDMAAAMSSGGAAGAAGAGMVEAAQGGLGVVPAKTGYKKIDAMMGDLKRIASSSGIPLGLLVGWIARESGGRIDEAPKPLKGEPDSERGYFQLTPSESKSLGIDHKRLSTDHNYSLDAGVKLIEKYMKNADAMGVFPKGSVDYWKLVKLGHTMGSGAAKIIALGAKSKGQAGSWAQMEQFAFDNDSKIKDATNHSPKKWMPHVDKLYEIGKPFGFGDGGTTVVGGGYPERKPAFTDIPDVLDLLVK